MTGCKKSLSPAIYLHSLIVHSPSPLHLSPPTSSSPWSSYTPPQTTSQCTPQTPVLTFDLPKKTPHPSYLICFLPPSPPPHLPLPSTLEKPLTFAATFFPSLLSDDSPPTRFFTQFSSCAKGNHPWKMFWPAVIAASHMLPISLTPEPCVRWNEPLEDTHTHTRTQYHVHPNK